MNDNGERNDTTENKPDDAGEANRVTLGRLLAFFIPLGFSASLVTISHVIINSTLARAPQPEVVIASYALPMSIMGITERPAVLLRQTCSVLVKDRRSFRAMALLTLYVLGAIFAVDLLIGYTPLGHALFTRLFGVRTGETAPMLDVYRVLMFVTVFSGIRCVFHGIIISNLRTKWLTIGMIIRLIGMYALALYFIQTGSVTSGRVGAIIFLAGMVIEAAVCFWEGRGLLRTQIPERAPDHPVERPRHIFKFYKPLLYSSFIAVVSEPTINAYLSKTPGLQLSVAAFAVAASVAELVQSFFSYTHQIVLNFYRKDAASVRRFMLLSGFIPGLLIAILAYTPAGPLFMGRIMGLGDALMTESLRTLRVFMLVAFLFPWLDYGNGLLMLRNQTRVFVWSQIVHAGVVVLTLVSCIALVPGWNGMIGALAQSLGTAAEAALVLAVLWRWRDADGGLAALRKQSASFM